MSDKQQPKEDDVIGVAPSPEMEESAPESSQASPMEAETKPAVAEPSYKPAEAEEPEEDEDADPLHIGNLVEIISEAHGSTIGRVTFRDLTMVRVIPQEASDRAIEFPLKEDGSAFIPDLGVASIEVIETQASPYFVDFLGVRPGELLEFFTADGQRAAENGVVAEVISTETEDALTLTDGRRLEFGGVGPESPIAVIRVSTSIQAPTDAAPAPAIAAPQDTTRQTDLLALLRGVLPAATVEVVPTTERTFPDSMQREDMFQDLVSELSAKQRTNPRRIRLIEREVDLAVALKNKSLLRDSAGRVRGPAPHSISTLGEAVRAAETGLPAAIPIVTAARVLNLDEEAGLTYKSTDVVPRSLPDVERASDAAAEQYSDGENRTFFSYIYDLLTRDQVVLSATGATSGPGWTGDQDVIRTAGLGTPVQGLSTGLPGTIGNPGEIAVTTAFLINDVTDRAVRALAPYTTRSTRTGQIFMGAPSDPSTVSGFVMLPAKAALALRPPKRPGDLPTALIYSAALADDNLPTVAQTLRDLYSPSAGSALNAWTLSAAGSEAADYQIADWLEKILPFAVHPADSLGPRTPALLSLLDSMGIGAVDMSPAVAGVVNRWVRSSQQKWRDLLIANRKELQAALDAEPERTFQSVAGMDSPLWPVLQTAEPLHDLLEDIGRRNPTIVGAPTLTVASLIQEAQGDATPLVWTVIAKMDARDLDVDPVSAAAALSASRAYALRRRAVRDFVLLSLRAAPDINTCPHVNRLEAIRNLPDVLQRSRLLRDFVEEFQGGRTGDWMLCALCQKECVCYHELMELEALAQPARTDAIQKQILIRFGGERYEGKIICKNCGQGLQDIDYDDHVEFDDNGNAIVSRSVLSEEQLEEPTQTAWRRATEAMVAPRMTFETDSQRSIGDALLAVLERAGLRAEDTVIRQIVRYADLFVSLRSPPQVQYEAARAAELKKPQGRRLPTYDALMDQTRVAAITALLSIMLQVAEPPIAVSSTFATCPFGRDGWPLEADGKPEDSRAAGYVSCVVASFARDERPWNNLPWSGAITPEPRIKQARTMCLATIRSMLGADGKQPLPFTPEIQAALTRTREDTAAAVTRALVSIKDELPVGFRPEPFPARVGRPVVETAVAAAADPDTIADALRRQGMAVVSEMHAAASAFVESMGAQKPSAQTDAVCCPVPLKEVESGALLGAPENTALLQARVAIRDANPTGVASGTHLWSVFATPVPVPPEQTVEPDVFFKLFLRNCYQGPQVGAPHEFSYGNICRQCGFVLGKPMDMVDFAKEGAAILAAQQGPLRVETTAAAFEALSEAVRRRKILEPPVPVVAGANDGLVAVLEVLAASRSEGLRAVAASISAVVNSAEPLAADADEIARATFWAPISAALDELREEISERIGPVIPADGNRASQARAREAVAALATLDTLTEDPFQEGPRAIQEYWCAKTQAAAAGYAVDSVKGSRWFKYISDVHNALLVKILTENATAPVTGFQPILTNVAQTLGPVLSVWVRRMRPMAAWTTTEFQMMLRLIVFQSWRDAVVPTSWMYGSIPAADAARLSGAVGDWTRSLMSHAKKQFVRYSKERIKQVLQERAELERTSVVQEFEQIKDDDQRAATLLQKQFGIGRWGRGANIRGYNAEMFEFEVEQRHRMGIVDAPVPTGDEMAPGARPAAAAAEDYGFGALSTAPESGYDMGDELAEDGADY